SDANAAAVVDAALAHGMRLFDTAPLYGYGLGERRLGAALAGRDAVISTKVGRLLRTPPRGSGDAHDDIFPDAPPERPVFDFSAGGVRRSLEESLQRLGRPQVDILHIHDPDDHYAEALAGAYPALAALRADGTIRAVGAGMNQSAMLTDFARAQPFDCFLLAGRYTLLDQSGLADLLPECSRRGISVIIGGVYNSGMLADLDHAPRYDYGAAPAPLVAKARRIEEVCRRHDVPLRAAALQFPFGHPAVATVLAGARDVAELDDNVRMLAHPIPDALWRDLKAAGLLPEEVPTP